MNRKTLDKLVKYWTSELELDHYNIEYRVEKPITRHEDTRVHKSEHACILVLPEEKKATILFNKTSMKNLKEETVLHELVHILLAEMDSFVTRKMREKNHRQFVEHLEDSVVRITKILLRPRRRRGR